MQYNSYNGGYTWFNGLLMTDKLHDTLEKFCEYAKAQGDTINREEVLKTFEKMIMQES